MNIVVIDGQGGGLGKSIVEAIKSNIKDVTVIGVGTNSIATSNLKRGGCDAIATGENAIVYNAKNADIIVGPIGICFPNSMYGEISPLMANTISESEAIKYLIPISKCNAKVMGVENKNISDYIDEVVQKIKERA